MVDGRPREGSGPSTRESLGRGILGGFIFLFFALVYWTAGLLAFSSWVLAQRGETGALSFYDVQIAATYSLGFMALSGYFLSSLLLFARLDPAGSWARQAMLCAGLFLLHVGVFTLLVGSSPPGGREAPWILVGLVGVLAADATTRLLGRSRRHKQV